MAKRFTDTNKYDDEWFRRLPTRLKCFWDYICCKCDNAGFWKIDWGLASFQIGEEIKETDIAFLNEGKQRVIKTRDDKYLIIVDFIDFQMGFLHKDKLTNLQKNCIDILVSYKDKYPDGEERAYIDSKLPEDYGIPTPNDAHPMRIGCASDAHRLRIPTGKGKGKGKGNSNSKDKDIDIDIDNKDNINNKDIIYTEYQQEILKIINECKVINFGNIDKSRIKSILDNWETIYKGYINIGLEIMRADGWLLENKIRKVNYARFLGNWFKKTLDKKLKG